MIKPLKPAFDIMHATMYTLTYCFNLQFTYIKLDNVHIIYKNLTD